MNALPAAAMLLSFDIDEQAQREHDDWHSHEHMPERLALPGFVRGSRWRALAGGPGYFVMYEVRELGVLASAAYMQRLNHPSPWTAKMMPSYRGMKRGLCEIVARSGHGLGGFGLLLRFDVPDRRQARVCDWLSAQVLPSLAAQSGLASAWLFKAGMPAELTVEQRIRSVDAGIDWALLVTGYARTCIDELASGMLSPPELSRRGASDVVSGTYGLAHCFVSRDLA